VRIAEAIYNTAAAAEAKENVKTRESYIQDDANLRESPSSDTLVGESDAEGLNVHERKVLDRVAEDLARLGRVKRVGLGVKEKIDFVKAWSKTRRIY
jgi:1-acylglycerol-3-phosphate O-acyltransferase